MLVQAAAASCWVVGSSTAAAVPLSLSARRDSERASRSIAVIAFADGGSGRSTSSSPMLLIVLAVHHKPPTADRAAIPECRKPTIVIWDSRDGASPQRCFLSADYADRLLNQQRPTHAGVVGQRKTVFGVFTFVAATLRMIRPCGPIGC